MNINVDKSAIVHFKPVRHKQTSLIFHVNDSQIPIKNEYKYLGMILDEYLTLKKAAEIRNDQAMKVLWNIQAKTQVLSGKVFKKLFESLVQPVLDYGSIIWSLHVPLHQNRA